MKQIILAIILSLIGLEIYADNTTLINQVKREVRSQLKDPSSARFDYVYVVTTISGVKAVCGEVNAKNSYGGYTGFTPFYSYKGYIKIIPDTDNEYLAQFYSTNYAEAGCAGLAAEKAVYEKKKKDEARWKAIEQAKKEAEEKAKKEEEDIKKLIPYAVCTSSYDYIYNRVAKHKNHEASIKEVKNIYDNYYVKYGKGESFETIETGLQNMVNLVLSNKNDIQKVKKKDKDSIQQFINNCVKSY